MSFLSGFIGGVAGAYNDERDAEKLDARKKQMAEYESELQMKRLVMQETLREKFAQATAKAKRDQDVADGKTIQDTSEAKRYERSGLIMNADPERETPLTPEQIKVITDSPAGLVHNKVVDRTAYQEQMDLSNAAGGIGRTDLQDKYTKSAQSERQFASDQDRANRQDAQTAAQAAETARKDKEGEARAEYQSRLAGAAEARAAAAERRANGGDGNLSKEERLKYTSLFSESSRRMSDAQKLISTLTKVLGGLAKDNYGQPDTPEITDARQQIESLRGDYNAYKDERSTYQALLAGTEKTDAAPAKPEADKFVPGKKYKDAKGNVATYMGNGKWN